MIDTNLLLLVVVGNVSSGLIGRHKRTQKYSAKHYDAVIAAMRTYSRLVITPGIAVETSNWIGYIKGADHREAWGHFSQLVMNAQEIQVPAATACEHPDSHRLGITDCSILIGAQGDVAVLTDDEVLQNALHESGICALHLEELMG